MKEINKVSIDLFDRGVADREAVGNQTDSHFRGGCQLWQGFGGSTAGLLSGGFRLGNAFAEFVCGRLPRERSLDSNNVAAAPSVLAAPSPSGQVG